MHWVGVRDEARSGAPRIAREPLLTQSPSPSIPPAPPGLLNHEHKRTHGSDAETHPRDSDVQPGVSVTEEGEQLQCGAAGTYCTGLPSAERPQNREISWQASQKKLSWETEAGSTGAEGIPVCGDGEGSAVRLPKSAD